MYIFNTRQDYLKLPQTLDYNDLTSVYQNKYITLLIQIKFVASGNPRFDSRLERVLGGNQTNLDTSVVEESEIVGEKIHQLGRS